LAGRLLELIKSPERLEAMANRNFASALQMTMPEVVRSYVRSFERNRRLKVLQGFSKLRQSAAWFPGRESVAASCAAQVQAWDAMRMEIPTATQQL